VEDAARIEADLELKKQEKNKKRQEKRKANRANAKGGDEEEKVAEEAPVAALKGMVGGKAGLGPAWTRGEIERPLGEENMGTSVHAVYTQE